MTRHDRSPGPPGPIRTKPRRAVAAEGTNANWGGAILTTLSAHRQTASPRRGPLPPTGLRTKSARPRKLFAAGSSKGEPHHVRAVDRTPPKRARDFRPGATSPLDSQPPDSGPTPSRPDRADLAASLPSHRRELLALCLEPQARRWPERWRATPDKAPSQCWPATPIAPTAAPGAGSDVPSAPPPRSPPDAGSWRLAPPPLPASVRDGPNLSGSQPRGAAATRRSPLGSGGRFSRIPPKWWQASGDSALGPRDTNFAQKLLPWAIIQFDRPYPSSFARSPP